MSVKLIVGKFRIAFVFNSWEAANIAASLYTIAMRFYSFLFLSFVFFAVHRETLSHITNSKNWCSLENTLGHRFHA